MRGGRSDHHSALRPEGSPTGNRHIVWLDEKRNDENMEALANVPNEDPAHVGLGLVGIGEKDSSRIPESWIDSRFFVKMHAFSRVSEHYQYDEDSGDWYKLFFPSTVPFRQDEVGLLGKVMEVMAEEEDAKGMLPDSLTDPASISVEEADRIVDLPLAEGLESRFRAIQVGLRELARQNWALDAERGAVVEAVREMEDNLVRRALGLLALWGRRVREGREELAAKSESLQGCIATVARMRDDHAAELAAMQRRVDEAEGRARAAGESEARMEAQLAAERAEVSRLTGEMDGMRARVDDAEKRAGIHKVVADDARRSEEYWRQEVFDLESEVDQEEVEDTLSNVILRLGMAPPPPVLGTGKQQKAASSAMGILLRKKVMTEADAAAVVQKYVRGRKARLEVYRLAEEHRKKKGAVAVVTRLRLELDRLSRRMEATHAFADGILGNAILEGVEGRVETELQGPPCGVAPPKGAAFGAHVVPFSLQIESAGLNVRVGEGVRARLTGPGALALVLDQANLNRVLLSEAVPQEFLVANDGLGARRLAEAVAGAITSAAAEGRALVILCYSQWDASSEGMRRVLAQEFGLRAKHSDQSEHVHALAPPRAPHLAMVGAQAGFHHLEEDHRPIASLGLDGLGGEGAGAGGGGAGNDTGELSGLLCWDFEDGRYEMVDRASLPELEVGELLPPPPPGDGGGGAGGDLGRGTAEGAGAPGGGREDELMMVRHVLAGAAMDLQEVFDHYSTHGEIDEMGPLGLSDEQFSRLLDDSGVDAASGALQKLLHARAAFDAASVHHRGALPPGAEDIGRLAFPGFLEALVRAAITLLRGRPATCVRVLCHRFVLRHCKRVSPEPSFEAAMAAPEGQLALQEYGEELQMLFNWGKDRGGGGPGGRTLGYRAWVTVLEKVGLLGVPGKGMRRPERVARVFVTAKRHVAMAVARGGAVAPGAPTPRPSTAGAGGRPGGFATAAHEMRFREFAVGVALVGEELFRAAEAGAEAVGPPDAAAIAGRMGLLMDLHINPVLSQVLEEGGGAGGIGQEDLE